MACVGARWMRRRCASLRAMRPKKAMVCDALPLSRWSKMANIWSLGVVVVSWRALKYRATE